MNEETDNYFDRLHQLMLAANNQSVTKYSNPATPPPSQVEELNILYRTKTLFDYMCQQLLRRQTPRRVSFVPLPANKTSTTPTNKWYPKSWMSWNDFRPEDLYFAGAVATAISRKYQGRMNLRAAR